MYICICMCIHIYVYIYICIYVYRYIYTYVYVYIRVYVCICIHMYRIFLQIVKSVWSRLISIGSRRRCPTLHRRALLKVTHPALCLALNSGGKRSTIHISEWRLRAAQQDQKQQETRKAKRMHCTNLPRMTQEYISILNVDGPVANFQDALKNRFSSCRTKHMPPCLCVQQVQMCYQIAPQGRRYSTCRPLLYKHHTKSERHPPCPYLQRAGMYP